MTIYEVVTLILMFGVLALCAYVLFKVRKIHLMQFALKDQFNGFPETLNLTYKQIQAFIVLDRYLELPYALPPLRGWAASPDFLLVLVENMRQTQPEIIVECSSGASTVILAQCAKHNGKGHIYSLEHDKVYAEKTRADLKKQGLEKWASVIDASLIEYDFEGQSFQWYRLDEYMKSLDFDMLVIDGPPKDLNPCARYPAGPLLLPRLNIKGKVFLDDADRVDEKKIIKDWLVEYDNLGANSLDCEKGAVILTNRG